MIRTHTIITCIQCKYLYLYLKKDLQHAFELLSFSMITVALMVCSLQYCLVQNEIYEIKCLEAGKDPNQAILLLLSDSGVIPLCLCVKLTILVWEMQTEKSSDTFF